MFKANKIAVSELLFSHIGTKTNIEVELPPLDENPEITIDKGQFLEFEGMKIENGIYFYPLTHEVAYKYHCSKCLKEVKSKIQIRPLEKQYYIDKPDDLDEDLFDYIDKKHFDINMIPFIEELVYLSIPTILTCGDSCPGLESPYLQKESNINTSTKAPFADLKDLLK